MKILLTGGDREILRMTGRLLQRSGYEVCTAPDPAEVPQILGRGDICLVILDCDMGRAQGLEMIRGIRKMAMPPRLLVISGKREDEVPFLEAGADDWVQKPYQMDVLLARMAALLRLKT